MKLLPEVKTLIDFALGDGYISLRSGRKNAHMRIVHAAKQQEYAKHKEQILRDLGFTMNCQLLESKNGKNAGRSYYYVSLYQHPHITTAYHLLYKEKRKGLDKTLLNELDGRTLAYWFMDDGSAKIVKYLQKGSIRRYYTTPKIGAFKFSNQSFTLEENKLFVDWLKGAFDIDARITAFNGIEVFISTIPAKEKFINVISPYIIPSMHYKIQYPITLEGIDFTLVDRDTIHNGEHHGSSQGKEAKKKGSI